jgi:hypothetical protein
LSITFRIEKRLLLHCSKSFPMSKIGGRISVRKKETKEPLLFIVVVTWESFRDAIKEKYYPVGSYDDLYEK